MITKVYFHDPFGLILEEAPWKGSNPPPRHFIKRVGNYTYGFELALQKDNWISYRQVTHGTRVESQVVETRAESDEAAD